jgi:carboxypeptidase PM20D1
LPVNFRLLPGDGGQFVIDRVKEIINDDRINIEVASGFISEASEVTPVNSFAYATVNEAIRRTFPGTITSPFLLVGGTDSRYFGGVSKGIIKFSPMMDPIGFHGIDERVSLESYRSAIWFYEKLLRNIK